MMYKIRVLKTAQKSNYSNETLGITFPYEITAFFPKGTFFKIEKSGNSIICSSGAEPRLDDDLESYNFEDVRI